MCRISWHIVSLVAAFLSPAAAADGTRHIPLFSSQWETIVGVDELRRHTTIGSRVLPPSPRALREQNWKEALSKRKDDWSPYKDNGGTVVAVAGSDYVIIGADTRLSDGYSILNRNTTRIQSVGALEGNSFLATSGCWSDSQALQLLVQYLASDYEWTQGRHLGPVALGQLLSNHLYYRRHFPFYTHCVVAGLDKDGVGAVFGFDAIGSFERLKVACSGGGRAMVQPVLDRLAYSQEKEASTTVWEKPAVSVSCDEALELLRNAFAAASERDVTLGDAVEFVIVSKAGTRRERLALSND